MEKDHADRSVDMLSLKECIKLVKRLGLEHWLPAPDKSYSSTFDDLSSQLKVTIGKSDGPPSKYFIDVKYSSASLARITQIGNSEIKDLYRGITSAHERFVNENLKKDRSRGLNLVRSLIKRQK